MIFCIWFAVFVTFKRDLCHLGKFMNISWDFQPFYVTLITTLALSGEVADPVPTWNQSHSTDSLGKLDSTGEVADPVPTWNQSHSTDSLGKLDSTGEVADPVPTGTNLTALIL